MSGQTEIEQRPSSVRRSIGVITENYLSALQREKDDKEKDDRGENEKGGKTHKYKKKLEKQDNGKNIIKTMKKSKRKRL